MPPIRVEPNDFMGAKGTMNAVDVVVMAAGKGTRMKSRTAKVLHRLAGRR